MICPIRKKTALKTVDYLASILYDWFEHTLNELLG